MVEQGLFKGLVSVKEINMPVQPALRDLAYHAYEGRYACAAGNHDHIFVMEERVMIEVAAGPRTLENFPLFHMIQEIIAHQPRFDPPNGNIPEPRLVRW